MRLDSYSGHPNGFSHKRIVIFTSTLALIAFEYGQISWVASVSFLASASGRFGRKTSSAAVMPKPPSERGPIPMVAVTVAPSGFLIFVLTEAVRIAERKQAE